MATDKQISNWSTVEHLRVLAAIANGTDTAELIGDGPGQINTWDLDHRLAQLTRWECRVGTVLTDRGRELLAMLAERYPQDAATLRLPAPPSWSLT